MIGLMMITAAIAAQGDVGTPLQPTGTWRVDLVEGACNLSRSFGSGDGEVTLSLRDPPLGDTIQFLFVTHGLERKTLSGNAAINLSPSGQVASGTSNSGPMRNGMRLTYIVLKRAVVSDLAKSTALVLTRKFGPTSNLSLTAIGAGLNALNDCNGKLAARWGIDATESSRIAIPAKAETPEGSWLKPDDYPLAAVRAGQQGTSSILFTITLDGHARDCKIVASSGTAILDAAACNAMETRARYAPALDKDGKPMISHKTRIATWVLPDNIPR